MIGRLVHRWLHAALRRLEGTAPRERLDWQNARSPAGRAPGARGNRDPATGCVGGGSGPTDAALPLWWQGTSCTRRTGPRAVVWKRWPPPRAGRSGRPRAGCVWTRNFQADLPDPRRSVAGAGAVRRAAARPARRGGRGVRAPRRPHRRAAGRRAPSAAQTRKRGHGLGPRRATADGRWPKALDAEGSHAGVIHPDTRLGDRDERGGPRRSVLPVFGQLAARQRSLSFGQKRSHRRKRPQPGSIPRICRWRPPR